MRRYPKNHATAAMFDIKGRNQWYIDKEFKIHSFYEGKPHEEICVIEELRSGGHLKVRTPKGEALYIGRTEICLDYIKEHYPEALL